MVEDGKPGSSVCFRLKGEIADGAVQQGCEGDALVNLGHGQGVFNWKGGSIDVVAILIGENLRGAGSKHFDDVVVAAATAVDRGDFRAGQSG